MKKPIREWLEEIADPTIREAAISQSNDCQIDEIANSLGDALWKFSSWSDTKEGDKYWRHITRLAENGQLETREVEAPKMKEGYIPYSNEQEKLWAIAQAERMGYKKWEYNDNRSLPDDDCIFLCSDRDWVDQKKNNVLKETPLIPLEIPEEATKPKKDPSDLDDGTWLKSPNFLAENTEVTVTAYISQEFLGNDKTEILTFQKGTLLANQISVFNINPDNYTKTEESDGTIILKPKNRKVWIEVFFSAGILCAAGHFSKKELEESIDLGKENGETLLEVIEREYKI